MTTYEKCLHVLLKYLIKRSALRVRYTNGKEVKYGRGVDRLTVIINDPGCIPDVVKRGSLGLGEAYMYGDIDLDGDIAHLVTVAKANTNRLPAKEWLQWFMARHNPKNTKDAQASQIQSHYDLSNDYYRLILDSSMTYSCAIFLDEADTLKQAQNNKRLLVLERAGVQPGDHILDIGCGWGEQLIDAAQKYGCTGVGITLSKEQHKEATRKVADLGLSDKIDIYYLNYQDLPRYFEPESFDVIISVGMVEHVGAGQAEIFLKVCHQMVKPEGMTFLHFICHGRRARFITTDPFIATHIFPGGYIPSETDFIDTAVCQGFYLDRAWSEGGNYAPTLWCWEENLDLHEDEVRALGPDFDDTFIRKERFYFGICRGGFKEGMDVKHFAFRKSTHAVLPDGVPC